MDEIQSACRKISKIIGVIYGNAFQTNILAHNAAVEAPRARERGCNFAVVIGEVRYVALRSSAAACEIKILSGTSGEKVRSVSRLVLDVGDAMRAQNRGWSETGQRHDWRDKHHKLNVAYQHRTSQRLSGPARQHDQHLDLISVISGWL